jgi:hypothetical protein
MFFFFFGAFAAIWFGGSWMMMWSVGALHAWFNFIPTMSYIEALEITFIPSLICVVLSAIQACLKA